MLTAHTDNPTPATPTESLTFAHYPTNNYHSVVFQDATTGEAFLTRSTITSERTIEWHGSAYPLVVVDVSSASHPFWTGSRRHIDTAGHVEKFRHRYGLSQGGRS